MHKSVFESCQQARTVSTWRNSSTMPKAPLELSLCININFLFKCCWLFYGVEHICLQFPFQNVRRSGRETAKKMLKKLLKKLSVA